MALLAATALQAQDTVSQGAEPSRGKILPYASLEEAAGGSDDKASRYITPITDFRRSTENGRTVYTAEYVYPASWLNRQVFIRVEAASGGYAVNVNGTEAGRIGNGAVPAEINITKHSVQGVNRLSIALDSDADPLLKADKDAWLGNTAVFSQPALHVRDALWTVSLNDAGDGVAEFAIPVRTSALNPKQARIEYALKTAEGDLLLHGYRDITLDMRREDTVRFSAVVPKEHLWSAENPERLVLSIRNRTDGRYAENMVILAGLREAAYSDGVLTVNGVPQTIKAKVVEHDTPVDGLRVLKVQGYNAAIINVGEAAQSFYDACDEAGIYAIPQAAIDTSDGGQSIRRGGNPSNDPAYTDEYAERISSMYYTTQRHPSVIAYSLGHGITNGINTYEAYLWLKRHDARPVIYDGAGREWNSDPLDLQIVKRQR